MRIVPALLAASTLAAAAPAAAEEGRRPQAPAPRLVNIKNLSCDDFLGLSEGERIPVIWYIAGDYKEAGPLASQFDLDLVPRALPAVWGECKAHPQANLRYVVVSFFKAAKPASPSKQRKQ
jgi:hypothetical protein